MKNVGNEVKQIRQEKHALEKRVIFYHRCFWRQMMKIKNGFQGALEVFKHDE